MCNFSRNQSGPDFQDIDSRPHFCQSRRDGACAAGEVRALSIAEHFVTERILENT